MTTRTLRFSIILLVLVAMGLAFWLFLGRDKNIGHSAIEDLLTVGLVGRGDFSNIDPAEASVEAPIIVVWNIYDRLVELGPDGLLIPSLAEDFSASEDLMEWRFNLRSGVRFNGNASRQVTAQDVKKSLERALRQPGYARSLFGDIVVGASEFIEGDISEVSGIVVQNSTTVVFRLMRPYAYLPERLATSFASVVQTDANSGNGLPPPGSGDYQLVEWDNVEGRVELKRVRSSQQTEAGAVAPDRINLRIIDNEVLAAQELSSGGIDWLEATSSAGNVLKGLDAGQVFVRTFDHPEIRMLAFNQQAAPFNGPDGSAIARALNFAIDRDTVVDLLGGGRVAPGPVPVAPYETYGLPYDPDRAVALLKGIESDNKSLTLLVEPVDEAKVIAEALVAQWKRVGLNVTAVPGRADFFERAVNGDYQMALAYYGPFVQTPEQYLWPFRKDAIPVPNVMRFESPDFEHGLTEYTSHYTPDGKVSQALAGILAGMMQDPPAGWIVKPPRFVATGQDLMVDRQAGIPRFITLRRAEHNK
ncbi:MAG: ABC transporter substrate-binding protein [Candidatus Thiodiazotropha endolucinida]